MLYIIGLIIFIGIVVSGCEGPDDGSVVCSTVGSSTTCIYDPPDSAR